MAVTNNTEYLVEGCGFVRYGNLLINVPEGYDGSEPIDVIVGYPGSQPNGDWPSYCEMGKENTDSVIILDTISGRVHNDEIVEYLKNETESGNLIIGGTDVYTHSLTDSQAVYTTIELSNNGIPVQNAVIYDGSTSLKSFDIIPQTTWKEFAGTGANLHVISAGAYSGTEQGRLEKAVRNGVSVTYSICDFDGNDVDGEFHAAVQRDVIKQFNDVSKGKVKSFDFSEDNFKRLTKDDYESIGSHAAYVTGINTKVPTLNGSTVTWDYIDSVEQTNLFSAKKGSYVNYGAVTLPSKVEVPQGSLIKVSAEEITIDYAASVSALGTGSNVCIHKDELDAFINSAAYNALVNDSTDANNLLALTANFKSNMVLKGDPWSIAYEKFDKYDEALKERAEAANELGQAIKNAIDKLQTCFTEYEMIDTSELENLKETVATLESKKDILESQKYKEIDGVDSNGNPCKVTVIDQDKVAEIAEVQANIDEANKMIEAINKLQETYDEVIGSIEAAMEKVSAFSNTVANITPSSKYVYTS